MTKLESTGLYALVVSAACLTCGAVFHYGGDITARSKTVWCKECEMKKLMYSWTSGNTEIDAIIRETQKEADDFNYTCLRWIPWDRISNLVEIGERPFGTLYSGEWLEGEYNSWSFDENRRIIHKWEIKEVTIKIIENTKEAEADCVREVINLFRGT